jgi:hypothetical protein
MESRGSGPPIHVRNARVAAEGKDSRVWNDIDRTCTREQIASVQP